MRDVLVVGDVNPDLLLDGDVVPRFGQEEQTVDAAMVLGGSGGICAAALAALGLRVGIAAAVGDDDLGRLARAQLAAHGVATDALQAAAGPTGLSVHLLGPGGDRSILTSAGAIGALDVEAAIGAIADGVRHVHLAGVFLVPTLLADGGRVVAAARTAGATVSVDTNYDPSGRFATPGWLGDADLLLPNAVEARALAGVDAAVDVETAARRLAAGGATVVVKLGAAGALLVTGDDTTRVPAPPAGAVVDAVGAGDAFDAGVIRARLDGRRWREAVALGVATGTLSLRERGPGGQPTLAEATELAGRA